MNLDHEFHTVFCRHQHGWFAAERLLEDMTRAATTRDIVSGQLEHVTRVIVWNPVEHTCDDVTADLATEIAGMLNRDDMIPETLIDFIETHAGLEYARGLRVSDATFAAE